MSKLTSKIAIPIILVGIFAIVVLLAIDYEQLTPSFYIIVLLLTIAVFFFGIAIGQNFVSPIKKLLSGATKLSKGNLSSRVYIETKDELSELAGLFNKIAEELEAGRAQQEDAEKTVSIKVRARTKDLEETINALEQKVKNRTIELERLIEESNKLQEEAKSKKTETAELRKEITNFRRKIGGHSKSKKEDVNEVNL